MSGSVRSNPLSVIDDVRTARLIACAEAARLAEWLPVTSGRRLVNLCRGVRMALAAGDERMAVKMMCDIVAFTQDVGVDAELRSALHRHIVDCLAVHRGVVTGVVAEASAEIKLAARQLGLAPSRMAGDSA